MLHDIDLQKHECVTLKNVGSNSTRLSPETPEERGSDKASHITVAARSLLCERKCRSNPPRPALYLSCRLKSRIILTTHAHRFYQKSRPQTGSLEAHFPGGKPRRDPTSPQKKKENQKKKGRVA